jgi:hypothetical protein
LRLVPRGGDERRLFFGGQVQGLSQQSGCLDPREVGRAALQVTDAAHAHSGALGELLLAQPSHLAPSPEKRCERFVRSFLLHRTEPFWRLLRLLRLTSIATV